MENFTNFTDGTTDSLTGVTDLFLTTLVPTFKPRRKFVMPLTYRIADELYPYSTYVLFCVGGIGNIFSFIIMSRKSQRSSNSSVYLRAMAIADFLTLWAYFMVTISKYYANFMQTDLYCQIMTWSQSAFQQMSSYLVIMISLERFAAVTFPLSVGRMFTRKVAIVASVAICVIFSVLNSPFFLFCKSKFNQAICVLDDEHPLLDKWNKFDSAIAAYTPGIAILILNVLIIVQVKKAQKLQQQMKSNKGQEQSGQITRMLLSISISYWFLTMPMSIYFAANSSMFDFNDLHSYSNAYLTQQVCVVLLLTNNSINFYLYCLTGKRFREEFLLVFCCKKPKPKALTMVTDTRTMSVSQISVKAGDIQMQPAA